jgi:hypothetical protein
MSRYTLTIQTQSDTCFSEPRADDPTLHIDISHERSGLPLLSAKTIIGLLRDTYESARASLDPTGTLGSALLGEAKSHDLSAKLVFSEGFLPEALRTWIATQNLSPRVVREAFTVRRTTTAEDRKIEAPKQDTLRVARVLPKGTTFTAQITALAPLSPEEKDLLDLLVCLTRHGGLRRNRGMGHLTMRLEESPEASRIGEKETMLLAGLLPLTLTLNAPCLISTRAPDENSRATRPYLSGAAIRGSIVGTLQRLANIPESVVAEIAAGNIRFLPAYPVTKNGRALPIPKTWWRERTSAPDQEAEQGDALVTTPTGKTTAMESAFVDSKGVAPVVSVRARTHQSRIRSIGNTRAEESTVYVYESLAAGQTFQGAIDLTHASPEARQALALALTSPLTLGRAARSGYGGNPTVEWGEPQKVEPGVPTPTPLAQGERFVLQFTAEALFRDSLTGTLDPSAVTEAVESRFAGHARIQEQFLFHAELQGYNRLWQQALPSASVIAAGSRIILEATQALSADMLHTLMIRPLGERVGEGLGTFALLPYPKGRTFIVETEDKTMVQEAVLEGEAMLLLETAQRRLYQKRLRRDLAVEARQRATEQSRLPSTSLLHRLRMPLRNPETWQNTWREWLGDSAGALAKPARDSLRKSRLHSPLLALTTATTAWQPKNVGESKRLAVASLLPDKARARILWEEEYEALRLYWADMFLAHLAKKAKTQENMNISRENAR